MTEDEVYMSFALKLAKVGFGFTWPNPAVGAVIVNRGRIVGIGYHRKIGEDHAEVMAIKDARGLTEDATMYVTLEPHSFYGLVPPCTDAIIKAGIKRVVIAMEDPNPKVSGNGIRILREKGIEVTVGVLEKEAKFMNRFFIKFHRKKEPYVILKYAVSMDGFIADGKGNSKWISNEESRREVHKVRGEVDAIMVGRKTLYKDNAMLNPRMVFPARYPVRIVAGRRFDDNMMNLNFFRVSGEKWILTTEEALLPEVFDRVEVIRCGKERIDFRCFLQKMAERNMLSLLVEGGASLGTSLLKENVVDEIILFKSPRIFGKGLPMFTEKIDLKEKGFNLYEEREFNGDIMLRYIKDGILD